MRTYLPILTIIAILTAISCIGCEPQAPVVVDNQPIEPVAIESAPAPEIETIAQAPDEEPVVPPVETAVTKTPEPKTEAPAAEEPVVETPAAETIIKEATSEVAPAPSGNPVLATIDGIDITQSEVEEKIAPQLAKMSAQAANVPPSFVEQYKNQLRQQALEGMIVEQLLDAKVKAEGIIVTDEDINNQIRDIGAKQNPPLSVDDMKALVEAYGQTFEQWKKQMQFEKRIPYQKLMESQWQGKVNITEVDAQNYYNENLSQFTTPETLQASHILISTDAPDPNADPVQTDANAKEKAEKLLAQVKNGADFATLARENSSCPSAQKGGDLGSFPRGQMVPKFDEAAFALKVGQVSDLVKTRFGYHIIKLTDKTEASTASFEEAKKQIIDMLTQKEQGEIAKQFIDSLKAKANIIYAPGYEPMPVPNPNQARPRPPRP